MTYDLSRETSIVWLADPDDFDYVREWHSGLLTPGGKPGGVLARPASLIVAYATIRPTWDERHSGLYERRVWWLRRRDDRPLAPDGHYALHGGAPAEAVVPGSIRLGKRSRAWWEGRPGDHGWRGHTMDAIAEWEAGQR